MFRKSGSLVPFYLSGDIPEPGSDEFLAALKDHRFRSIEQAASEETSTGWITQADPSGGSFDADAMDFDGYFWLRMRTDKKVLPAIWLRIHRAAAERAAGRKLNMKERQDLREDLQQKLLPRVLPSVALNDAVLFPRRNLVFLHASSKAVREAFTGLFFRTFRCSLQMADPGQLAQRLGLGAERIDYLQEVSPVAWPRAAGNREGKSLTDTTDRSGHDQTSEAPA